MPVCRCSEIRELKKAANPLGCRLFLIGAGNETRTRDLLHGKQML